MTRSTLELLFVEQARTSRVALVRQYERDYRFHPVRRWQLDFAWLTHWLALEIEGGIWTGGAHARPVGIQRDIDKSNALTLAGWRLIRASAADVIEGRAIALVETLLGAKDGEARRQRDDIVAVGRKRGAGLRRVRA